MKLLGAWMLPVILLLVAGLAGCGEEPQQAADEPKSKAAKPNEGQESADETSPDRPVTPTRDQAVEVLSKIQSAIEAGVSWRHERADGKRLLSEIQSAIEAGEQHSKDFEAEVNVLKHFHRAPEWDGKRFKGQVTSLLKKRALLPPVIKELSQDGVWGRADELFDKDRLRRRVALHDVKADDCYALVLKNGNAETIFHWNGKTLAILHYSEPAVRESLDKFVAHGVGETQSKDGSARALSHYLLGNLGPHAESAIPAISKLLTHDDPSHRIRAAITLWKIDRRSSVSVPPLINMLADTKLGLGNRAMAADGLGIIGPQASGAKAALLAAMGEKKSRLRVPRSAKAGETPGAMSERQSRLHSKLRLSAAWALWKTTGDSKSTRPVLLDLLKDGDPNVFSAAAKTLGEMGWDKESLAAFVAVLEANPNKAFTMRRLTQTLVEALTSDDVEIRKEAIVALSKINAPGKLDLKNTSVSDLSPLKGLANLKMLYLTGTQVSDLSPLKGLTNLKRLYLTDTPVKDLSPLKGLKNLWSLNLDFTKVSDLSPLEGLTNLKELVLSRTQVTDFSPLKGLTNLKTLSLRGTPVTDLSGLEGLTNLKTLDLSRTQVTDFSPLKGLTNLKSLSLRGTPVTDLSGLEGLTNLYDLVLNGTQVKDLSPLAGLTSLKELSLDRTQVKDLSPLKGLTSLKELSLVSTQVKNLSPLKGLTNLRVLDLRDTQVSKEEVQKLQKALPNCRITSTHPRPKGQYKKLRTKSRPKR